MGRENTSVISGASVEAGGAPAQVTAYSPPTGSFGTATKFGPILEVYSAAAGNLFSNGT